MTSDRVYRAILTFGGVGLSPRAPGTVGSAATSLILLFVLIFIPGFYLSTIVALGFLAGAFCVLLGQFATLALGGKDPQMVVLDEVAGVCLTMLWFIPMPDGWRGAVAILIGFAAFRVFDVLKPPPCKQLEKLPHGWGILMDDLMAAVYANATSQFLVWLIL